MIKIIENSLKKYECEELISIACNHGGLQKMHVLGNEIPKYRTANGCWIYENNDITNKIKEIVKLHSELPIENQEHIHIVKYDINGEYKPHHDFFHLGQDYYESVIKRGGQRVKSFLFYLNDVKSGGETEFTDMKITISPKVGRLLIWDNIDSNGNLDYTSLHAGLPVIDGEKWIALVWVREGKFQ